VLLFLKHLININLNKFSILILLAKRKLLILKLYIINICYSFGVKFYKVYLSYKYNIIPIRQKKVILLNKNIFNKDILLVNIIFLKHKIYISRLED